MHRRERDGREHARDRRLNRRAALSLVAASAASAACRPRAGHGENGPLLIAVSSSLADFVREELRRSTEGLARTGSVVEGATATLVRQIAAGAPFDAIVAADEGPLSTPAARALLPERHAFAEGTLALVTSAALAGVRSIEALAQSDARRIALPNPETAPFGRAAREAIERLHLWERLSARVLLAENVRHALTLAARGEVDAAFTARSLLVTRSSPSLPWTAVAREYHQPLSHLVALTRHAQGQRRASAALFLSQLRGLSIDRLRAFGMDPPR